MQLFLFIVFAKTVIHVLNFSHIKREGCHALEIVSMHYRKFNDALNYIYVHWVVFQSPLFDCRISFTDCQPNLSVENLFANRWYFGCVLSVFDISLWYM